MTTVKFGNIHLIAVAAAALAGLVARANGATLVSEFDDLNLTAGTYWDGNDLSGGFRSEWARFRNRYDTMFASWSGFAHSSVSNTNTAGHLNQFAVWTPGAGLNGTGVYAVVFDSSWDEQDVVDFPFPVCVRGFYVNNTTFAALSMRDGDAFAKKFGGASGNDPDWFKLTVTGKDGASVSLGSVDFYLADFRFADNALDYIVGDWTWVDLTALGPRVRTLHFALSSSDNSEFLGVSYMNTPAYFAMDNLTYSTKPAVLTADFEKLGLASGHYWNGSDGSGGFASEWVVFSNDFNSTWGSWSGFAYSSVNNTNAPGHGNQYAVWTPGVGRGGTCTYAIGYYSSWDNRAVVTFPAPALAKGFYVNNTTFAALSMRDGDMFAKKFGGASGNDPDWFKLTVTGKDDSGVSVGSVDFFLADFRFTTNALDYIVSDWTWVDLTALGPRVRTLHFALSSSDNSEFFGVSYMNTPAFFAMDDLRFVYTFSGAAGGSNLFDAPVPGFVGPHGDGLAGTGHPSNYVNAAFAGWATEVVAYAPAAGVASQWTNSALALGPVTGDHFDVVSLGDLTAQQIAAETPPGSITLRMGVSICDGEGPDFAVFENGFIVSGDRVFGELGYVEVSSDGTNFTRFPTACLATTPVVPFGSISPHYYYGFVGKHANNSGRSWGTPFDLGNLACHPDVQSGMLNLTNVNYVRIVDIPGNGSFYDTFSPSNRIFDPWTTIGSGGVDLEAVGVLNSPDFARVKTRAIGPGRIAPYGSPDGAVAVRRGSNVTFTIAADQGFHLVDVLVNGVSQGRSTNYTFNNVLSDQTLTAVFGSRLVVQTAHGISSPAPGTHYGYGPFELALSGAPPSMGTTQYVFRGWTGSGSVPATGNATFVRVNLTQDSSLTWEWDTNYWMQVTVEGPGSVNPSSGWRRSGTAVTCAASAERFYEFRGWSGDVTGDTNELSTVVSMFRPMSVHARFGADLATNAVPIAWFHAHGLTNVPPDEAAMSDRFGKGMAAWQEFFAGTDPNDPRSVFEIVDFGVSSNMVYVIWVGGAHGSTRPFVVEACSQLGEGWTVVDGNVARTTSITNEWRGAASPSNRFYRIKVNTGP